MRIAILGSASSWYWADLARAAAHRHQLVSADYRQLAARVSGPSCIVSAQDCCLNDCDAVLLRSLPPGTLEQVIFRMDALGQLAERQVPILNPPRAVELAVDKFLATARLAAAGLRVPETCTCQTAAEAMLQFDRLGGDVVLKPLFGSEGKGMMRLSDLASARAALQDAERRGAAIYLQRFIPHAGSDLRVLVIGDRLLGMRRSNPHDWRTNVSLGARVEALAISDDVADIARRAARAAGCPLAGVDILPGNDGQLYVLEVNAVPGWKALVAATGEDVGHLVLEFLEQLAG